MYSMCISFYLALYYLSTHIVGHKTANITLSYAENICSKTDPLFRLQLLYAAASSGKKIKVNSSPILLSQIDHRIETLALDTSGTFG